MQGVTTEREKDRPKLRRALTLWDLVIYGIILIQPTAPMPLFGVVSQEARGHVVTTVLIAMIAMFVYGDQLRPDGTRISERRLRVYLCRPRVPSRMVRKLERHEPAIVPA